MHDANITDRVRRHSLQDIDAGITGLILDLRARVPEPPPLDGDPPRI
jgi:hypothetical protein